MDSEQKIKLLAAVSLPVMVIIFYVTATFHFSYTPDDTYIYLQFAKNFIGGNGMSFNAGEPTYGFTSPLWLLIISLGGKMGVDIYFAAKVLDLFLASVSIAIFFILAFEVIRDVVTALLATAVFSMNAWLIRWTGSGMETSLAVLLVLLAFWYCIRNEYILAIVVTTLLSLVRPESFLLVGCIVVDLYINSKSKPRALKMGASLVLLYLVFLLPWWIYAYVNFGRIFPNTGLAKAGLNLDPVDILHTLGNSIGTVALTDGLSMAVILFVGLAYLIRRKNTSVRTREDEGEAFYLSRNFIVGGLWIVSIVLLYSVTGVNVVSRYFLLVIPIVIILAFLLTHQVLVRLFMPRFVYSAIIALTILMCAQNQLMYRLVVLPRAEAFESSTMEYCFIPIGKYLAEHSQEGETVLVPDIGAIGYFSQRKIYDPAALISPEMLPLLRQGNTPYQIVERKLYRTVCSPDYIIDQSATPYALTDSQYTPIMTRMVQGFKKFEPLPVYYSLYKLHGTEKHQ